MGSFQGPNFFNVWTSKISNFVRDCLIFLHSNFSPLSLRPPPATFNSKNLKMENFIGFLLWCMAKVSASTKNTMNTYLKTHHYASKHRQVWWYKSSRPGHSLFYNSVIPNLLSSTIDLTPWLTRARYRKLGQWKWDKSLCSFVSASGEYPLLGCRKPVGG